MRSIEKRAWTAARQARRSSVPTSPSAAASCRSSARTKPVVPSSTISGAAPRGVVTTGVPHARASIMHMPNGSSHRIGFRRGAMQEFDLVSAADLADVLDAVTEAWSDLGLEVLVLEPLAPLGGA